VELLLDELVGGFPWRAWDRGMSDLLDVAVAEEERA
jgi:hypothetical protein